MTSSDNAITLVEQIRDFLQRLSEWDVLNLTPGSGDDGPYWQGEIAKTRTALDALAAELNGRWGT